MRAVILAAGRGGRLSGVVGSHPKCLARVGDSTLIERQIATLHAFGIELITVVAGYRAEEVARACGPGIDIALNRQHASTNSLYSFWLVRDLLVGEIVVLNCDVLFAPQLLSDLLSARYDDAVLVCARGTGAGYSDEEMKVQIRRGLIAAIDKQIDDADADAENIGIAKFSSGGAAVLVEQADRLVAAGAVREWLPRAFDAFCRLRPLYAVESRGYPWIEIDFPEDYWRACSEVLPAILATGDSRREATAIVGTAARSKADPMRAIHHV